MKTPAHKAVIDAAARQGWVSSSTGKHTTLTRGALRIVVRFTSDGRLHTAERMRDNALLESVFRFERDKCATVLGWIATFGSGAA